MRKFLLALVVTLALAGGGAFIAGCFGQQLAPEKAARVEAIVDENVALGQKLIQLKNDAKAGKLDPVALIAAMDEVHLQMDKNKKEIESIHAEAVAAGVQGGLLGGVGGRTVLHGISYVAGKFGGPVGLGISAILTLILGGSASTAKNPAIAATKPT